VIIKTKTFSFWLIGRLAEAMLRPALEAHVEYLATSSAIVAFDLTTAHAVASFYIWPRSARQTHDCGVSDHHFPIGARANSLGGEDGRTPRLQRLRHISVAFPLATCEHVLSEPREPAPDAMEQLFGNHSSLAIILRK
jgi:hypothetical protein